MSKNMIIGVVVAIVAVVAIGGYMMFSGMPEINNDQNQVNGNTQQNGKKMAFLDFVKQGGSYKCEVTQLVNNVETKGTTYLSSGMMRGEYNSTIQGMEISSMMIMRDGYAYSWSSALPNQGFKIQITATGGDANAQTSGTYGFDGNQFGDYNCEAWSVDQSKFAVPTDITFQTIAN